MFSGGFSIAAAATLMDYDSIATTTHIPTTIGYTLLWVSAGEGTAWEWTVAGLRSVYVIRWISYYYDDHCAVDVAENIGYLIKFMILIDYETHNKIFWSSALGMIITDQLLKVVVVVAMRAGDVEDLHNITYAD